VTAATLAIGGGLAILTDGALHDFFKGAAIAGGATLVTTGAADVAAKVAASRAKAKPEPKRNAGELSTDEAARILADAKALAERSERTDDGERRQAGRLIPMPPHLARNFGGGRLYMRAL